ncbi:hypothetical protein BGZ58_008347 [Dissophora ornata]|nr:hypothetical protein BGZ58_008347 [Dissophora ornata]
MTVVAAQPSFASALLVSYLTELATNPLRTKALTSGTLSGLQEFTATKLSGVPASKNPNDYVMGIPRRVVQMTLYGFLVSGPLAHALFELVTKRFLGKEGAKWKIAQILSSQLISSPIQNAKFLPLTIWVPFFNLVAFVFGTYINTSIKKSRLAQMKREQQQLRDAEKRARDEL